MIVPYVYDAGALVALVRGERAAWARHRLAVEDARRVLVPSPVLAQVWRDGRRQYHLGRVLRSCEVVPMDDPAARVAGELCGRAGMSDVVDAMVLVIAQVHAPAIIWTSDPGDLEKLSHAVGRSGRILLRTV